MLRLEMARGDARVANFGLYIDGQLTSEVMDNIYFTVKNSYYNGEPVLQKSISNGGIVGDGLGAYTLTMEPEDTDGLEFGEYDFDIEVVKLPNIKQTFIGKFILSPEVTHRNNEEE